MLFFVIFSMHFINLLFHRNIPSLFPHFINKEKYSNNINVVIILFKINQNYKYIFKKHNYSDIIHSKYQRSYYLGPSMTIHTQFVKYCSNDSICIRDKTLLIVLP